MKIAVYVYFNVRWGPHHFASLNGTNNRMWRLVLGVSWNDNINNYIFYGSLPKLSDKIRSRTLKLAGHCIIGVLMMMKI